MFLRASRNILWLVPISLATLVNFSAPRTCTAQALYGALVGNVTDPSGASVPQATVTVLHKATGQSRQTKTNDTGGYSFPDIATGTYEVTVTKEGFFKFDRQDVEVSIDTVVRVDAQLQVGSVAESVQVSGQAPELQTDRAEVLDEITSQTLQNLPMPVYRSYQNAFVTLPGFAPPSNSLNPLVNPGRAASLDVNGTSTTSVSWKIDGSNDVNVWMAFWAEYMPALDSIETVDVVTNAFDAEQGLAGGAAVNVQIKSGTNAIHGSAFEYHTDNRMKAKPFFLPVNTVKPKFVFNQTGGTVGGPVKKNKIFYFLSFEGSFDMETGGSYLTLPTAAQVSGNLSVSSNPIYDPATGNADGTGRTPFPGNIIPQARFSPVTNKILQLLTPPPMFPNLLTNNFYASGPLPFKRYVSDAKGNWNATRKLAISGRVGIMDFNSNNPPAYGAQYGNSGSAVSSSQLLGVSSGQTINMSYSATYLATAHLIIDGNFGWTSFLSSQVPPNLNQGPLGETVLGIPGSNGNTPLGQGWPTFSPSGYSVLGAGTTGRSYDTPQKNIVVNGNWTKGTHNIRFGTEMSREALNDREIQNFGGFSFSGGATSLNGGPAPNQFNGWADFLLGQASGISIQQDTSPPETVRTHLYSFYVRDQWQASRKLTVSYGVRWEYFPMGTRANRGMEIYNAANGTMLICGVGNTPTNCGVHVSPKYFSPRLGLAYRVSDTFVIRAGAGINFEPNPLAFTRDAIRNYPVTISNSWSGATTYTPAGTLSAGVPAYTLPDLSAGAVPVPANVGVQTFAADYVRGYVESWNITMQKEFRKSGFVAQAGYVASRQVKQAGQRQLNIGSIGGGRASQPYYQLFGDYSSISEMTPTGNERYDSLQAILTRRFAGNFSLRAAYTWSKAIGVCCDTNADGGPSIALWQYRSLNKAVMPYDRTQNFNISGTADLPFGKGQKWLNGGGVASAVFGGWKLSSLLTAFTGAPFTVSSSSTPLNCPNCGSQQADQVLPNVQILGHTGPGQWWFNPLAYAPVTALRYGTSGLDVLRGPGAINLDQGIYREINLSERFRMEVRATALNACNTPHFNNPGGSVSSMILNPDGTVKSTNGFAEITSVSTRREGVDERMFQVGVHVRF